MIFPGSILGGNPVPQEDIPPQDLPRVLCPQWVGHSGSVTTALFQHPSVTSASHGDTDGAAPVAANPGTPNPGYNTLHPRDVLQLLGELNSWRCSNEIITHQLNPKQDSPSVGCRQGKAGMPQAPLLELG